MTNLQASQQHQLVACDSEVPKLFSVFTSRGVGYTMTQGHWFTQVSWGAALPNRWSNDGMYVK